MSGSDRRSSGSAGLNIPAILGWAIAVVLAIALYSDFLTIVTRVEYFGAEEAQCRADEEKADTEKRATTKENKNTSGDADKYDPHKSAREYCIARRAAIAGERQAAFAKGQVVISFVTLVAAILAAIFAAKAAWATQSGADEAKRSADVAERNLIATMGASVTVRNFRDSPVVDREDNVVGWRFWVEWENTGTTQTKDMESMVVGTTSLKRFPDDHVFSTADKPGRGVIAGRSTINSGTLTITPAQVVDMLAGKTFYYFWGWSEYGLTIPNTPRYRVEFHTRIVFNGDPLAKRGGATFEMHGTQQGQRIV